MVDRLRVVSAPCVLAALRLFSVPGAPLTPSALPTPDVRLRRRSVTRIDAAHRVAQG